MFSYNENGNITFNGVPYTASSHGTTGMGLQRAANFADWLNKCLLSAPNIECSGQAHALDGSALTQSESKG